MTTITFSVTGSTLSGLTGGVSRNITISDPDLQSILNYIAATEAAILPPNPTNPQILNRWVQVYVINKITADTQSHGTTQNIPPPITMT